MKKYIALILSAIMAATIACGCRKQPSNDDNSDTGGFSAVLNGGKITVTDTNGNVIQVLDCPDAIEGAQVRTLDCNFDGYNDISVIYSRGTVNSYYHFWIYDEDAKLFFENETLRLMASPNFNSDTKTVSSYEKGSASDYISSVYEWSAADDDFNCISKQAVFGENGKLRYVQSEYRNGAEKKLSDCYIGEEAVAEIDYAISNAEDIAESRLGQTYGVYKTIYLGEANINQDKCHRVEINTNGKKIADLYLVIGEIDRVFLTKDNGATFETINISDND
ncbi:MAG: XAC2610-related protein [Oscillospiraceae bacterium]